VLLLLPSPVGLFIHSSCGDFSSPTLQSSGHPVLFPKCLLFPATYYSDCFFALFSLGRGQSVQGDMLIYHVSLSSPWWSVSSETVWKLASGSVRTLLVSLFNVEWGCYAWAGGVEESKFCFFLVVFPAMHISSVSPRFYFRKHAFCFLPLVTILKSLPNLFLGLIHLDLYFHPNLCISS
jgi:hypothetical protein